MGGSSPNGGCHICGWWDTAHLFPEDHPDSPSVFKGMAIILVECGYMASNLWAECKGFKCSQNGIACCCRCILFNEPDFADVDSLLGQPAKPEGFRFYFFPSSTVN